MARLPLQTRRPLAHSRQAASELRADLLFSFRNFLRFPYRLCSVCCTARSRRESTSDKSTPHRKAMGCTFGRSGETRTRGLMVPNHARYQLRYTSWSGKRESNPQPSAWEATALPLSHFRKKISALLYQTIFLLSMFLTTLYRFALSKQKAERSAPRFD